MTFSHLKMACQSPLCVFHFTRSSTRITSCSPNAVRTAVSPQGVEHQESQLTGSCVKVVQTSVSPQGVEHRLGTNWLTSKVMCKHQCRRKALSTRLGAEGRFLRGTRRKRSIATRRRLRRRRRSSPRRWVGCWRRLTPPCRPASRRRRRIGSGACWHFRMRR